MDNCNSEQFNEVNMVQGIYRDKQFDNKDYLIFKMFLSYGLSSVPLIFAYSLVMTIHKYYEGETFAGSPEAAVSGWLIIVGIIAMIFLWKKAELYNNIGNRLKYYLVDKEGNLYHTNIGANNSIKRYYNKNVPLAEKLKYTPILFKIFYFGRGGGYKGNIVQQMFKYNLEHHFVENLLISENYRWYCDRIVKVKTIKKFRAGVKVRMCMLINGESVERMVIIYNTMDNYNYILQQLTRLQDEENRIPEVYLSKYEKKQIDRAIWRKFRVVISVMVLSIVFMVLSYSQWENAYINWIYTGFGPWGFLARRAKRRMISLLLLLFSFVWMGILTLLERVQLKKVKVIIPKVVNYYESENNKFNKFLSKFPYMAEIEYIMDGKLINDNVPVTKELWENKNQGATYLVLTKGVPYYLVHRQVNW